MQITKICWFCLPLHHSLWREQVGLEVFYQTFQRQLRLSKVGNITRRDNSLLLLSGPFSSRKNFRRGDSGSDHRWSQQCSLQREKHVINTGKHQRGTDTNSLFPKLARGSDLGRKKITIDYHWSFQEKSFRELRRLLMLLVYSREKRLTHYDLGPVYPKNDAWMAGHRQLLSGDLDEEIRVSPRFCPQQILRSFIHSRVFQVSLKRGLIRRVIKSSKEWVHQWEQSGCQKQEELSKEVRWQSQRAASTFQLLSEDQSNPPGLRVHLRGQSLLSSVSALPSGVTVIFPEEVVTFSGTPAFLPGGVTFCPIWRCTGPTAIPPGLTTRWPTGSTGFSPGLSVFPSGAAVCLSKVIGVLVGVIISLLVVVAIVADFPLISVATASPPGGKMPKLVVKSLVIVGISGPILEEFTAVENHNFGEGVELNSRRNQQKRVRLLPLPSHPVTGRTRAAPGMKYQLPNQKQRISECTHLSTQIKSPHTEVQLPHLTISTWSQAHMDSQWVCYISSWVTPSRSVSSLCSAPHFGHHTLHKTWTLRPIS